VTAIIWIWATDPGLERALSEALSEAGRDVRVLEGETQLAAVRGSGGVLVAQAGPRLTSQQAFVRGPVVLVDPERVMSTELASRAYAVVADASQAGLAVDRFLAHRRLSERVVSRRESPRRCSRCGRGFDALKAARGGSATRFVRFGSVALCGRCVEELRSIVRQATAGVVEADA
jgi:hypothetical protein